MRRPLAAALLAALAVAACSGGGEDDTAASGEATAEGNVAADRAGAAEASAGSGGGGDAAGTVELVAAQLGRQVVRTGTVRVSVEDVAAAAADAVRVAEAAGGFQAAGSLDLDTGDDDGDGDDGGDDGGPGASAEVVLRVPAAQFRSVLAAIGELGEVTDQQVRTEDVTGRVVDLEGRVAAARVSVERVRGFLDRTGDIAQLAAVERELLTRESELESLLGQLAALRDQVDLATITARFSTEPDAADADPADAGGLPGPGDALRNGWELLVDAGQVTAAAAAFAVPFAPLAVLAVVAVRLARGRARRLAG
jgi:hypothetical protein